MYIFTSIKKVVVPLKIRKLIFVRIIVTETLKEYKT